MKKNYHDIIISHLKTKRIATSEEIAQLLNVSISTARRITLNLEKQKIINRFHGGVMLEPSYIASHVRPDDIDIEKQQKQQIAEYVCNHIIQEGQTVYLGSGTTIGMMGVFLQRFKELTIITNNLLLVDDLTKLPHIQTLFTGGIFNPYVPSTVGEIYPLNYLTDKLIVDSAFVTSPCVSLYGCSQQESYIRQVIEEHFINLPDTKSYLLANNSKLGQNKSFRWAEPSQFFQLITNHPDEASRTLEQVFPIKYCTQ